MILGKDEIKRQLKLEEDDTGDDVFLEWLGKAVEAKTATFLNRPLYVEESERVLGDNRGIVVTDDIRLAMLMLVTHFYENRSTVTEVEKLETPMAYNWLVGPYRFIPL